MAEGTIKKWFSDKGYGFIERKGQEDLFFHIRQWKGPAESEPQPGDKVTFKEGQGKKGLEAQNVQLIGAKPHTSHQTRMDVQAASDRYHFLNPYNFVRFMNRPIQEPTLNTPEDLPLWHCPPPPHDRYVGLTGRVTCKVEAVTPLFISDSHAIGEENGHKTYRFFQVDARPALPASSLRGMFRSVFEAVTNSCFVVFQEDKPYHLEHRESHAPDMIPSRLVELGKSGARLELLDCTVNAPGSTAGRPTVVRAAAVLRSYPPKVLNQRTGQTFNSHQSQLPQNAYDGMRVAALVTRTPVPHGNRFRAFQAEQVVPANQHQSLTEEDQFAKVFGWLHLTGPNIENKHDERLFFRWDDKEANSPQTNQIPTPYLCECSSAVVEEYNHHLAEYWDRLQRDIERLGNHRWPNSAQGVPHPSVFVERGRQLRMGDLVYVQRDAQGNAIMLRPVSMPRIRYVHSRQSFLPEHLRRCRDYERLCPACRVFGWVYQVERDEEVSQDKVAAYAGRVRLSHGKIEEGWEAEDDITLAILSTPKPTTTPFYLLNSEGQSDAKVDYDTDGARLRGRKFYRHHGEMMSEQEYRRAVDNKDDQNRTVRGALKQGATFTFTLDFENLAPLELGALLYALELEEGMFHRLGYAKPLGFGSVKVTVESVQTIDWEARLRSIEPDVGWQPMERRQCREEFFRAMQTIYGEGFGEMLADLRTLLGNPELPVHYPRPTRKPQADGKNYEWFVGNNKRIEKLGRGDLAKPEALPLAKNDTTGLPLIDKDGR
ncbi:MAG: TIGR03986 family CRISPR-associated RAMP protein [Thermodesulfobacteriota bacterium]